MSQYLLVNLDCLVESLLLLCAANLEVVLLISWAGKRTCPNGMLTVRIESYCLALRGLLTFAGRKLTCPKVMQTVLNFLLGPQSSHDLVNGQTLIMWVGRVAICACESCLVLVFGLDD